MQKRPKPVTKDFELRIVKPEPVTMKVEFRNVTPPKEPVMKDFKVVYREPPKEPTELSKEVFHELLNLHNKGLLTPEGLLNAATNPQSPLHGCFEWDDAIAGHKYRLEQARKETKKEG